MTAPNIPQLRSPRARPLLSDIGQAATSLVAGSRAEKERQRSAALQDALLKVQQMNALANLQPDFQKIVIQTPEGPRHARINIGTGEVIPTEAPAIENLFFGTTERPGGELAIAGIPRAKPLEGPPQATEVTLPPGQTARDVRPSPITVETPAGPRVLAVNPRRGTARDITVQGRPLVPKADEPDERRARDAFEMVQSQFEMKRIAAADPAAYEEAARHITALDIGEGIPVIGEFVQAVIRNSQSVLSPAAAGYFAAFMSFAQARAFGRGGATLTRNEIDYALGALAPKPGESPDVTSVRERLVNGIITGMTAGNPAWQRFSEMAKALGFTGDFSTLVPGAVPSKPRNRFGYVPRQS